MKLPERASGLPDLESQYRGMFENAIEGIYQTTTTGRYLRVNPALARMYGYDSPRDLVGGLTDIAGQLYVDPARRAEFARIMHEHGIVSDFQSEVYRRDGSIIWISENARCVRDGRGDVLYYEGTVQDITRRKADESEIRLLATVFANVADGILLADIDRTVRAVNPAFQLMTGFNESDIVGRPLDLLAPGYHERGFMTGVWQEVMRSGRWTGEITCRRSGGMPFLAEASFAGVQGDGGECRHVVITCADISLRKEQELRIRHHASYDLLTGLPNRLLTTERLEQAVAHAARYGRQLAVLFLDLNGFKEVNDVYGHQSGDQLLRLVGRRLRTCTRLSDMVGRLGGDEFLIIAEGIKEPADARAIAEKILYSCEEPFELGANELYCRPAIGIACYPSDGLDAESLIGNADIAMYEAKRNGAGYVTFAPQMRADDRKVTLEHDLHEALKKHQLLLVYQPKLDVASGRITGAEALIRWRHPQHGLLSPNLFIPVAERRGLIVAIGEWVLREACAQFKRWQAEGMPIGSVSVNLSPRQFHDANLVQMVRDVLHESGLPHGALELELTESAMAVDIAKAAQTLEALRALGVRIAIDDFGTGHSSLGYLKRLPVDTLKIDRSFVIDLGADPIGDAIVGTIVQLAETLGCEAVAEGVETVEQADILRGFRCHQLQGYWISKPVEASEFAALVRARGGVLRAEAILAGP